MLTEGTEEYKEKVKEANEASRDLIEQLGLIYGKDYTIDSSTGEIIINDSVDLEAAQHEAEERVEAN
jgi:hypothetical protein